MHRKILKPKSRHPGIKISISFLLLISCNLSWPIFAADDTYLRELEIEAEKSAHVSNGQSSDVKLSNTDNRKIPDKAFKKFELTLKSTRPATYRFYKKLDTEEQHIVYTTYNEDQKLTRASKMIFDLYFKKNK